MQTLASLDTYIPPIVTPPNLVTVNFCTDPAVQEKSVVKTVIILDHSGSNQRNYHMAADGSGAPDLVNGNIDISVNFATDPTGALRYGDVASPGTLLNYLSTLATNSPNDPAFPTRYFALVDFSDQALTYPPNTSGFTSNLADFYAHVRSDSGQPASPLDGGSTSYLAALEAAYKLVNDDVQAAAACAAKSASAAPTATCPRPGTAVISSYVLIFMSDGSPITKLNGVGADSGGNIVVTGPVSVEKEPTNQILGEVETLMALTANTKYVAGVNLFTIYYYNPLNNRDQSASDLLAQMAKLGNGLAYNAVSGTKLDYSRFLPPAKTVRYALADVFVSNASVVWAADGTLKPDRDGDGLPDDLEISLGLDPARADSNGNGVSDLVEYRLSGGKPCAQIGGDGRCADPIPNYAQGACAGIPHTTNNGVTTFASSDPNGLNDCEKTLLGDAGGVGTPDSNGDAIPDWLEFRLGLPFQLGSAAASATTANDGYTDYQKVKYSLPTAFPLSQLQAVRPAGYDLTQLSTSASQDCYRLVVSQLPMLSPSDNIRVDVIERSALLQDRYLYRTATKSFSAANAGNLNFNDWNDAAEKQAGTWKVWQ